MAFYSYEILIAKNIPTVQELNLDVSGLSTLSATNPPPPLSGPRRESDIVTIAGTTQTSVFGAGDGTDRRCTVALEHEELLAKGEGLGDD